jgi:hypothetical protein
VGGPSSFTTASAGSHLRSFRRLRAGRRAGAPTPRHEMAHEPCVYATCKVGTLPERVGTLRHRHPPRSPRVMDCRTFRRQHVAFVDDTLPGIDVVQMERHRNACDACARLDRDVRRSLLLIRNNLPTIEPSAEFSARLARRLEEERKRQAAPAPFFRGPGVSGFLSMSIGVVALGLFAVVMTDRPGASEGEEAARLPSVVLRPTGAPLGVNSTLPVAPPAFVASVSTGMAVWPALLMMEEAQSRYAGRRRGAAVRTVTYTAESAQH